MASNRTEEFVTSVFSAPCSPRCGAGSPARLLAPALLARICRRHALGLAGHAAVHFGRVRPCTLDGGDHNVAVVVPVSHTLGVLGPPIIWSSFADDWSVSGWGPGAGTGVFTRDDVIAVKNVETAEVIHRAEHDVGAPKEQSVHVNERWMVFDGGGGWKGDRKLMVWRLDPGTVEAGVGVKLSFSDQSRTGSEVQCRWMKLMTEVCGGGRDRVNELVALLYSAVPDERALVVVDLEQSWKSTTPNPLDPLQAVVIRSHLVPLLEPYSYPMQVLSIPQQDDFLVPLDLKSRIVSLFSVKYGCTLSEFSCTSHAWYPAAFDIGHGLFGVYTETRGAQSVFDGNVILSFPVAVNTIKTLGDVYPSNLYAGGVSPNQLMDEDAARRGIRKRKYQRRRLRRLQASIAATATTVPKPGGPQQPPIIIEEAAPTRLKTERCAVRADLMARDRNAWCQFTTLAQILEHLGPATAAAPQPTVTQWKASMMALAACLIKRTGRASTMVRAISGDAASPEAADPSPDASGGAGRNAIVGWTHECGLSDRAIGGLFGRLAVVMATYYHDLFVWDSITGQRFQLPRTGIYSNNFGDLALWPPRTPSEDGKIVATSPRSSDVTVYSFPAMSPLFRLNSPEFSDFAYSSVAWLGPNAFVGVVHGNLLLCVIPPSPNTHNSPCPIKAEEGKAILLSRQFLGAVYGDVTISPAEEGKAILLSRQFLGAVYGDVTISPVHHRAAAHQTHAEAIAVLIHETSPTIFPGSLHLFTGLFDQRHCSHRILSRHASSVASSIGCIFAQIIQPNGAPQIVIFHSETGDPLSSLDCPFSPPLEVLTVYSGTILAGIQDGSKIIMWDLFTVNENNNHIQCPTTTQYHKAYIRHPMQEQTHRCTSIATF
ncbi:hypothetical protein Pelo_1783 [Pelomyxa schiedti]|nr:hypothetical protein Pelo_1783 [Pelomyxa schiedti]